MDLRQFLSILRREKNVRNDLAPFLKNEQILKEYIHHFPKCTEFVNLLNFELNGKNRKLMHIVCLFVKEFLAICPECKSSLLKKDHLDNFYHMLVWFDKPDTILVVLEILAKVDKGDLMISHPNFVKIGVSYEKKPEKYAQIWNLYVNLVLDQMPNLKAVNGLYHTKQLVQLLVHFERDTHYERILNGIQKHFLENPKVAKRDKDGFFQGQMGLACGLLLANGNTDGVMMVKQYFQGSKKMYSVKFIDKRIQVATTYDYLFKHMQPVQNVEHREVMKSFVQKHPMLPYAAHGMHLRAAVDTFQWFTQTTYLAEMILEIPMVELEYTDAEYALAIWTGNEQWIKKKELTKGLLHANKLVKYTTANLIAVALYKLKAMQYIDIQQAAKLLPSLETYITCMNASANSPLLMERMMYITQQYITIFFGSKHHAKVYPIHALLLTKTENLLQGDTPGEAWVLKRAFHTLMEQIPDFAAISEKYFNRLVVAAKSNDVVNRFLILLLKDTGMFTPDAPSLWVTWLSTVDSHAFTTFFYDTLKHCIVNPFHKMNSMGPFYAQIFHAIEEQSITLEILLACQGGIRLIGNDDNVLRQPVKRKKTESINPLYCTERQLYKLPGYIQLLKTNNSLPIDQVVRTLQFALNEDAHQHIHAIGSFLLQLNTQCLALRKRNWDILISILHDFIASEQKFCARTAREIARIVLAYRYAINNTPMHCPLVTKLIDTLDANANAEQRILLHAVLLSCIPRSAEQDRIFKFQLSASHPLQNVFRLECYSWYTTYSPSFFPKLTKAKWVQKFVERQIEKKCIAIGQQHNYIAYFIEQVKNQQTSLYPAIIKFIRQGKCTTEELLQLLQVIWKGQNIGSINLLVAMCKSNRKVLHHVCSKSTNIKSTSWYISIGNAVFILDPIAFSNNWSKNSVVFQEALKNMASSENALYISRCMINESFKMDFISRASKLKSWCEGIITLFENMSEVKTDLVLPVVLAMLKTTKFPSQLMKVGLKFPSQSIPHDAANTFLLVTMPLLNEHHEQVYRLANIVVAHASLSNNQISELFNKSLDSLLNLQNRELAKDKWYDLLELLYRLASMSETLGIDAQLNWKKVFDNVLPYYEMTMSSFDQIVFELLQIGENCSTSAENVSFGTYGYRFGSAFFDAGKQASSISLKNATGINVSWFTEFMYDKDQMHQSIQKFPFDVKLSSTVETNACMNLSKSLKTDSSIYDPRYLLPLLAVMVLSEEVITRDFAFKGYLGYALRGLSSDQISIRKYAYGILNHVTENFELWILDKEASKRFSERKQLLLLLSVLKEGVSESYTKVSSIASQFLSDCVQILLRPSHAMYGSVNQFLLARESFDHMDVPMFYQLFHSEKKATYKVERLWILYLFQNGIRDTQDISICNKRHVFPILQTFYASPVSDEYTKTLVLEICLRSTEIKQLPGIYAWLETVAIALHHSLKLTNIQKRDCIVTIEKCLQLLCLAKPGHHFVSVLNASLKLWDSFFHLEITNENTFFMLPRILKSMPETPWQKSMIVQQIGIKRLEQGLQFLNNVEHRSESSLLLLEYVAMRSSMEISCSTENLTNLGKLFKMEIYRAINSSQTSPETYASCYKICHDIVLLGKQLLLKTNHRDVLSRFNVEM